MPDYSEQLKQDQEWQRRADDLQQQEWAMAHKLLQLGRRLLLSHLNQLQPTSLAQIQHIVKLSSQLAALAGVQAAQRPKVSAEHIAHVAEAEATLHKIYGAMAKSGVIPNVQEEINRQRANYGQSPNSSPQQPPAQPPQADQPQPPTNPS